MILALPEKRKMKEGKEEEDEEEEEEEKGEVIGKGRRRWQRSKWMCWGCKRGKGRQRENGTICPFDGFFPVL